jgi:transposase-like protein
MLAIHPNARTTPAVRAEIARSQESSGVLASRYGVSSETIRKWRKRGPADCQDRSARPHKLPWKASEEERARGGARHRLRLAPRHRFSAR